MTRQRYHTLKLIQHAVARKKFRLRLYEKSGFPDCVHFIQGGPGFSYEDFHVFFGGIDFAS